jgi:plasmid stabilization system protein ParE
MADKIYHVQILDPAQGEIEEIAQLYLSLAGASSARKIMNKIYDALEQLTWFPLLGPAMRETELRKLGYRFLVVEKYIAVYRLIGDTVFIYHIFDSRSDYPTLFKSELFK